MINPDSPNSFKALWTVPSTLMYFRGHFPEKPILPAVAIIDTTVELVKKSKSAGTALTTEGSENLVLTAVKNAKFLCPIEPEMSVEITVVQITEERWKCKWESQNKLLVDLDLLLRREILN